MVENFLNIGTRLLVGFEIEKYIIREHDMRSLAFSPNIKRRNFLALNIVLNKQVEYVGTNKYEESGHSDIQIRREWASLPNSSFSTGPGRVGTIDATYKGWRADTVAGVEDREKPGAETSIINDNIDKLR